MSKTIVKQNLCDPRNYRSYRKQSIKYIVLHYTAGVGDTDEGNGIYFAGRDTGDTSAHYFVDEDSITQSVQDNACAFHCGGTSYRHAECRNDNAIGIEMCSDKDVNGNYIITPATVNNAVELTKYLMDKYSVPIDRVIRHYDVTGKNCPAPWVQDESQWTAFKTRLVEGVIDLALEKWMVEGGEAALDALAAKGLINTPDTKKGEAKLAANIPAYLFWMMMNRLAEYKG